MTKLDDRGFFQINFDITTDFKEVNIEFDKIERENESRKKIQEENEKKKRNEVFDEHEQK